jgi:hypothetical protein
MEERKMSVQDISKEADQYLTRKAREALKNKANTTVVKNDAGEVFMCAYLGALVSMSEIEDGIKLVAGKINQLAQENHIHSCLSHFVRLDLPLETTGYFDEEGNPKEAQTAILCYVLVPENIHKNLEDEAAKIGRKIQEKT